MHNSSHSVALITGAVGNLGLATARAFQNAGYRTVLVDRSADRLRKAYPELIGNDRHLFCGDVDLTSTESIEGVVGKTLDTFGRIDVLVNTVGAWRGGKPLLYADLADWDFLFEANVRTTLLASRAVLPAMLKQQRGRVINVASRDALAGTAGYAAYSATKAAVVRLTEALAGEVKNDGITANCILPGTIDTPQNRGAIPNADFTKWVEPAAIADVILFLASDAARAVNGTAIPVFGKS